MHTRSFEPLKDQEHLMRFPRRLNHMIALSLCTAGVLLCLLRPASAALQVVPTATVTEVRAYADGNVHVTLSVNTACSGVGRMNVLRVGGAGADRVLSAALAALLAGHEVEVEYDDARSGHYCNLSYLRILARQ